MALITKPKTWILVGPVTALHDSARALCIRVVEDSPQHPFKDYWIPKGQINMAETEVSKPGDKGLIVISEWIAKEKGLI